MAEAAKDWTEILKGVSDPDGPIPALAAATTSANDHAGAAADGAVREQHAETDVWAETLARVYGAADLLRTREHQLRDLERVHRTATDRAAERIAVLEEQLASEGQRAERAERAQAEAEAWLHRIHTAVVERLPG
jgi:small-conductance mechanosensitive channel